MFTSTGAQGSWQRALRAVPLWSAALLGVLAVSTGGSASRHSTDHVVLSGYGSFGLTSAEPSQISSALREARANGTFRIAGSVSGLFPGSSRQLKLTVSNPQTFPIVVTSIATAVQNASASCTAANLSVSAFSGQLSVPAFGSAKVTVLAKLAYSAPNACIGSKFPLVYSGLGKA